MTTRFLKILSNGNKILKSKLMTEPSYMIIFNFSFPFPIDPDPTIENEEAEIFITEEDLEKHRNGGTWSNKTSRKGWDPSQLVNF